MDDLDRLYHRLVLNVRDGAPHLLDRQFRLGDVSAHLVPYRHTRRELGFESIQQYELALLRLASGERGYLRSEGSVQDALRRTLAEPQPDGSLLRAYADTPVALPPDALTRARVAPPEGEPGERAGAAAAGEAAGTTPAVELPHVPSLAATQLSARPTPGASHPPVTAAADLERAVAASSRAADAWSEASRPASRSATPATSAPTPSAAPPAAGPGPSMTNPTPHQPTPSVAHAPSGAGTCRYCGQPLPEGRRITFCPYCGNNVTVLQCPACSTELEVGWKFCITCGRAMDDAAFASGGGGGGGDAAGPPRGVAER